jgi:hypothetical protein
MSVAHEMLSNLHFEIRREDVAYHPQRAGLLVVDSVPPKLVTLTLEPLDDSSLVDGRSGPFSMALSGRDTVSAIGRLRAIVRASDRLPNGTEDTVPWSVGRCAGMRRATASRVDPQSALTGVVQQHPIHAVHPVLDRRVLRRACHELRDGLLRSVSSRPDDEERSLACRSRGLDELGAVFR